MIKLKNIAIEVNYQLFEGAVIGINEVIDEIASNLFDEPISISIELYKQVAKQTKPKINLSITYRGETYKNVHRISGGEENKVSVALCAAFSTYNKFPFIILDEALHWVSSNFREVCIETMKSTGKNIIVVSQTRGSAHADNILTLTK